MNAKLWKSTGPGAIARDGGANVERYPGRTVQLMRCVKLMGQRLMARDFDRQVVEIRIAALLQSYP